MNLFPNSSSSDAPPPGSGAFVPCLGETCYRIAHVDQLPPFLMSLVSASDHWLFIASNGGLTAGRVDAEEAVHEGAVGGAQGGDDLVPPRGHRRGVPRHRVEQSSAARRGGAPGGSGR